MEGNGRSDIISERQTVNHSARSKTSFDQIEIERETNNRDGIDQLTNPESDRLTNTSPVDESTRKYLEPSLYWLGPMLYVIGSSSITCGVKNELPVF